MDNKVDSIEISKNIPISEAPYSDLYKMGFFEYKRVKLILVWNKKISKNKQFIILKRLFPDLNCLTASQIIEIIRENDIQWEFAEMGWGNATDLAKHAQKAGLNILIKEKKAE